MREARALMRAYTEMAELITMLIRFRTQAVSAVTATPAPEPQDTTETAPAGPPKMEARNISVFYGEKQALFDVDDYKEFVKVQVEAALSGGAMSRRCSQ